MQIGGYFINIHEVNYFSVEQVTSLDIRITIDFKNRSSLWTRTNWDEINQLKHNLNQIWWRH